LPELRINSTFHDCLFTPKRYVHSFGGRGSGKSHQEALGFIIRLLQPSFFRGVLVRNIGDTIRNSQFRVICDLIEKHGLGHLISINESRLEFHCPRTGNSIISRGLRKSKKTDTAVFKSIADPTHVWIEEAEEIDEEDFNKIDGSVRKKDAGCQIRLTYNTNIEPDHWIRKKWHDPKREDAFYLFTTYRDNLDNLDTDYIISREAMRDRDPERYAVEVLGQWGAKQITRPFAVQYNPDKHRKPCQFQSGRTIYISFDFNLDPFAVVFAHIWRDKDGLHFHVFDEFTIQGGTLPTAITDIKTKYGQWSHLFHITGDYSGTAKQMSMPDKANHYQQIMRSLLLRDKQFELRPNPLHRNSHDHCNFILSHAQDFRIDPSCVNTERDLRTVEINSDQSIIKSDRKSDAQRADHLDAFRYLCNIKEFHEWRKSVR
jgi:phage terminase large subunit